jgi:hypothetical protein
MTLEQALSFRVPWVGKQLRHLKADDWHRFWRKRGDNQMMMDAFWRHQWDDVMDRHAHAQADRLDGLQEALCVILAD